MIMCNCIRELLNVFEDSAQREHTIGGLGQYLYVWSGFSDKLVLLVNPV